MVENKMDCPSLKSQYAQLVLAWRPASEGLECRGSRHTYLVHESPSYSLTRHGLSCEPWGSCAMGDAHRVSSRAKCMSPVKDLWPAIRYRRGCCGVCNVPNSHRST
ncbi:hypothetical protein BJV78DRAFT_180676 [Lactifluus subvellereus]|nr:hypothetical protein BJV78DRAFT_180676 [Lactifluus subvellereus]